MNSKNKIYLDYAATTPIDPRVMEVISPYFSQVFGNPSSVHTFGQQTEAALEKSRET
ncbi:MAG: aminotransferase class V-fold PLP-dependent enzyme, partial [Anaerolineales bacterium]|nr:aminotransferase class V-fold PLP-dependent enzyme [Anaerolineales bacterium]